MKKNYLSRSDVAEATKKQSGLILMPVITGGSPETKSDEDDDEEIKAIEQVGERLKAFKSLLGEKVDKESFDAAMESIKALTESLDTLKEKEVDKHIESINKSVQTLHDAVVKMQEEKAESDENAKSEKRNSKNFVSEADVKSFVNGLFPDGDTGEKNREHRTLTVKAAEQFGFSSIAEGADANAITGALIDPTLYFRKRKTNIILDYFDIKVINVPTLIYLRKIEEGVAPDTSNTGGAEWIACGAPKPMRSFRITTGEAKAKKVAIFNTIDDCLLQDVPSFDRWIREDFVDEMREQINNGLLNGNPEVNDLEPLGLKTNAVLFSAAPAFTNYTSAPNYIEAIFAIAATFAVNRERARVIFVSADVYYAIHALKATDGKFLNNNLVYVNNLGQLFVGGVEVVYVDSDDVDSTHFLAIGFDLGFKIYAYGDMTIETGLNGEDFREDKTSIRGWQRFLSFIPEDRENSVMYDTWANVFAAILKPDGGTDIEDLG